MRKGSICNFGLLCGGTQRKNIKTIKIYNWIHNRTEKSINKIEWISKRFHIKY
jgi:hypothetical protein